MYVFGHRLTEEQVDILKWVHLFRGITTRQLLAAKFPDLYPPDNLDHKRDKEEQKKKYGAIRKLIGKLKKKKLLSEKILPTKAFYTYLTESGLEVVNTILEIPFGKIGIGYDRDYGHFEYELYRPPSERMEHHLRLVDFFLMLDHLKVNNPGLDIEYRDNRYVSEKYVVTEGAKKNKKKFMPDGEVRLNGKTYFVEIDMGGERRKHLELKFHNYAEYFDYLHKQERLFPDGILFITGGLEMSSQFRTRWQTIMGAFFDKMERWSGKVNLIGGTIGDVENIIMQERSAEKDKNKLIDALKPYLNGKNYEGTKELSGVNVSNQFQAAISITKVGEPHQVFIYERVSGFQTRGIARILAFKEWRDTTKIKELKRATEVIPVLYHVNGEIPPLAFGGFKDHDELKRLFDLTYWLDIKEDVPIWTDNNGQRINHSNPLLTKANVT